MKEINTLQYYINLHTYNRNCYKNTKRFKVKVRIKRNKFPQYHIFMLRFASSVVLFLLRVYYIIFY